MKRGATLGAQLAQAARIVARVASGASLATELAQLDAGSRPALIDLTHGTLRRYGRGPAIVAALSQRGKADVLVQALLWCALYALDCGRYAEHTVVDEAVKGCGILERWNAKGYVNALLRNFLRRHAAIEAELSRQPEAVHQHPAWWIDLLRAAYPDAWRAALAAGNGHPPMCLRVNRRRAQLPDYQARLGACGMAATRCAAEGLLLERPVAVDKLPGFGSGEVSVQDVAAQRAAHCLDLQDGQRVLDACAAPGGKSAHILELADVELTALDIDPARAARIAPNLERLGLHAKVLCADASGPPAWWDGVPFDRVLADVPCSASGIVRRHPDVKWLRRPSDLGAFASRQQTLLAALWRLVAPGGKLLYATCSVFPHENDAVVEAFLARDPQARRLALGDGEPAQWLPNGQHDGFYYALIAKAA